jgi:hypothetical protein
MLIRYALSPETSGLMENSYVCLFESKIIINAKSITTLNISVLSC